MIVCRGCSSQEWGLSWEAEREKVPGDKSTEKYMVNMLDVVLLFPQGFQHKQWEAEEAVQGIPRWRWHPHQSKLFSFFFPSYFSCSSGCTLELKKWYMNLDIIPCCCFFFFTLLACSLLSFSLSCFFFVLPLSLRTGKVFGFHQAKTGRIGGW